MGGGSGIKTGAPVSPLNSYPTPLLTIESCNKPQGHSRSSPEERPHYPPLGLQNVGNTCYANAALQCLLNTALSHALLDPASTHIFRRYSSNPDLLSCGSGSVDSDEDDDSDEVEKQRRREVREKKREERRRTREKLLSQEKCQWLTGTLTDIARIYTAGANQFSEKESKANWPNLFHLFSVSNNNRTVDPSGITRHVHKLSPCLRPYQQEDAHEFIRTLLSTLTLDGRNKQLSSLFDGLLESAVTCQTCRRASVTRDRYMDLSLDIQDKEVEDLAGALRKFTQTEKLDKDNMVFCSRCNCKRMVTKGLRLATAPSILVCHLKRFSIDIFGRATRLSKKVKYPLHLEIGDYMSRANQGKPAPYELVGVVVHAGKTCERGHYLAYVKSGDGWYKATDEVVTSVSIETVLNQQAYILIYEIEGMRASHGFYGCGRYHLTRSRSSKKRAEDMAAMHSDDPTEEPSLSYSTSTSDERSRSKVDDSPPEKGLLQLIDSVIDFCGSTSAAEAVRDAMCDSEKKPRKSKRKYKQRHNSLEKAEPILSKTSSESHFSRITPSEDFSSEDGSLMQAQFPRLKHRIPAERIRSSSENDMFYKLNSGTSNDAKKKVFRHSGSLFDPRVESITNNVSSSLTPDSQLIKSCSSNNLLEREEEAAQGYEKESFLPGSSQYNNLTMSLHGTNRIKYKIQDDDRNSDPGAKMIVSRRRKSSSAPRAGMRSSPTRMKSEKRIDLPPLPVSKRSQS